MNDIFDKMLDEYLDEAAKKRRRRKLWRGK